MAGRILGGRWWSRPSPPPPPTNAGRDVSGRILQALQWALHGDDAAGEREPTLGGAVQAAAAAYERALSVAVVTAGEPTAAAVRQVLAVAGRSYVTRGEFVALVHFTDGAMAFEPVTLVEGHGTWAEPEWTVRRTTPGGEWADVKVARSNLLHVVYCPDPDAGGLVGRPPWDGHAARAAANLEGQLGDQGTLPVGHSLRLHTASELDDEAVDEFYQLATEAFGQGNRTRFAPLITQGSATDTGFLDTYGADFPASSPQLVEALGGLVLAASGVPPVLLSSNVGGSAYRDAWRAFLASAVQPVADMLARAVVEQLGVECAIAVSSRHNTPADLVSRARAVGSLTTAGVDVGKALEIAGLAP